MNRREEPDAHMYLNFVKEVQLIVEHFIVNVFTAVVKKGRGLQEKLTQRTNLKSPKICGWDCYNTVAQQNGVRKEERNVFKTRHKIILSGWMSTWTSLGLWTTKLIVTYFFLSNHSACAGWLLRHTKSSDTTIESFACFLSVLTSEFLPEYF